MLRLVAVLALVALFPVPAFAQVVTPQQVQIIRCAVQSVSSGMIVAATSVPNQVLVDREASGCSDLIATGEWVGVDNSGGWHDQGFVPVCSIKLNAGQGLDIWSLYGDTSSGMDALTTCFNQQKEGHTVTFQD